MTSEDFKKRGRGMYRDFLKEDLSRMKKLLEGMRYIQEPEILDEYKGLANSCLKWKMLIKLNK